MTTSTDIINEAVMMMGGNQPLVTGVYPTFDNSTTGKAAQQLYALTVRAVGRQFGWDFARNQVTLVLSGNLAPLGFTFEYVYPVLAGLTAVEVYQLAPTFPLTDPNNPIPVNWTIGNAVVGGVQSKVIWSNQAGAVAVINNNPSENLWDALFQQAVVRLLASAMAMAVAGKPDVAQGMLESGSAFETLGETRRD
jgi:hypothetical protein